MVSQVKQIIFHIILDFFHSRLGLGYPATFIVNTQNCTLANCVPMGLQTINATSRGSFIVPTNYESPFCGKFIEVYR